VVLFDLDGTIVDSGWMILASYRHATTSVLGRDFPDEVLMARVGAGHLEEQMREFDAEKADELAHAYREFGYWGDCTGGITPSSESCDTQDNDCNNCADDNPACCVVDLICRYEEDGRRYEVEAASSHLSLFLIGGAETFPKTFASAVHRLWQHADQRAALAADLSLVPEAYREALRFDMPTQYLMRRVQREVRLHGETLRPGQKVAFLYPSANRDPREFADPDRFDVHRRPPRILSFGHGVHACIGQHFARAEARLCLETLLRHAPRYAVRAERLRRLRTEFVQGWESMPVRWQG
jgi:cytochrome P450